MRPFAFLTAALAVAHGALAVDMTKSAIVWFEDASTPDSIIKQAKDNIIKAGGKITHEYKIIKCVDFCPVDLTRETWLLTVRQGFRRRCTRQGSRDGASVGHRTRHQGRGGRHGFDFVRWMGTWQTILGFAPEEQFKTEENLGCNSLDES